MPSLLSQLTASTTKKRKRVGRGYGSGIGGHTAGRGQKGQRSRSGKGIPLWFEGGQLPLIKRMPMLRGKGKFVSSGKRVELSLSKLNTVVADIVTLETLKLEKIISSRAKGVKIIATGEISKKKTVQDLDVTKAAQQKIEAAGGSITQTS
ncbi:MAG: 50S ribosomal protein L15 [Candidatus Pacebacteria bacterium]|nr:50S ribosomal protein L15 [Candidatus Paceibacterota bacterium]PIR60514.1 MAG: 50S ribosomal protein L15 [Candidatus Pacebacteria bacterium CG10_big_fil_rev_8_21_14_0_10_44_54]